MKEVDFPNNINKTSNKETLDKQLIFKNYVPINPSFTVSKLPYFDQVNEVEERYVKKVRKAVKDFINLEKNPLNIVPKKNNVDLKKSLAGRLDRLNRRTEIAILDIIKENLNKQKEEFENKESKEEINGEDNYEETLNAKGRTDVGNKLIKAMEMQMNLEEEKDEEDSESDISSDYDKRII